MSSVFRFAVTARRLRWPVFAAVSAAMILLAGAYLRWPRPPASPPAPADRLPAWPARRSWPALDWSVFRQPGASAVPAAVSLAKRYRLAGTFFIENAPDNRMVRRAILERLADDTQHVVSEGDWIDGVELASIALDAVVLREGEREEQLALGFAAAGAMDVPGRTAAAVTLVPGERVLEKNRYGIRVGERRWVFSRQRLLDYHRELLDAPDRLVSVFDSMVPEYDDQRTIQGYRLKVLGEPEFFSAVGLRPGDVVRQVNSVPMRSRTTAEAFIRQFVDNRLNAFVLEVERDKDVKKFVYMVR